VSSHVTPPPGIGAIARSQSGSVYIIAANPVASPVTGQFSMPSLQAGTQITVMFENRTITAGQGGFSDSFSGVDRHVYVIAGAPVPAPVTIATTVPGLALTVDGSNCTSPCSFQWTQGSNHTVALASPQAGAAGVQYVFSSWSDGGARSHTVTATGSASTYTASLATQYYLSTAAVPAAGGSIAPASGWFNSGSAVAVSATAVSGYQFSGFSGAVTSGSSPQTLMLNAPASVSASFTATGGGGGGGGNATVSFVKSDTTTQGSWKSKYGTEGYSLAGDATVNPAYVTPSWTGSLCIWNPSTSDVRALQKGSGTDRLAATWYGEPSFAIDLNFTDQKAHQVAIYVIDWDTYGPRAQTVDVLDASGNVLDSRNVSNFVGGQYLVWNITGHVKIRATALTTNSVIEGIFFGGAGSSGTGTFVGVDTTTQGNWKSKYGADGYSLAADATVNPPYVTPSLNPSLYVWTTSTTDVRALQKASGTDRLAATWYSQPNFAIDLNFTDQNTHQVAIYVIDWDSYGPRSPDCGASRFE